jgi:hypothetical protein
MASPLAWLRELIAPVTNIIEEVVTDKDKANELKASLFATEAAVSMKLIEYEAALVQAQKDIIVSEAQGESFLQRNWRPVTMMIFVSLVVAKWLGYTAPGVSEALEMKLMSIIELGLGGYVIGRSIEKTAPSIAEIFKKN